jgi:hypothetical protein
MFNILLTGDDKSLPKTFKSYTQASKSYVDPLGQSHFKENRTITMCQLKIKTFHFFTSSADVVRQFSKHAVWTFLSIFLHFVKN